MEAVDKEELLQGLNNFIQSKYDFLNNILSKLNWNLNNLSKENYTKMECCSAMPGHRMPESSLFNHIEACEKKHGTYPIERNTVSDQTNSVCSTMQSQSSGLQILTAAELECFSATSDAKKQDDAYTESSSSKQLIELLATERDAKRRRAAHRGKRVHTNRKSYSEILKEVISSQMEIFQHESNPFSDINEENAKQNTDTKDVVEDNRYLGIGTVGYDRNPYKLWQTIENEERILMRRLKSDKAHAHGDRHDVRRSSSTLHSKPKKRTYESDYSNEPDSPLHSKHRSRKISRSHSKDKYKSRHSHRSRSQFRNISRIKNLSDGSSFHKSRSGSRCSENEYNPDDFKYIPSTNHSAYNKSHESKNEFYKSRRSSSKSHKSRRSISKSYKSRRSSSKSHKSRRSRS